MQQQQHREQPHYALAGSPPPEAEHLLSLLHDGDRCLAEARLSLRRSRKLLDTFRQEGQRLLYILALLRDQVQSLTRILHWAWASTNAFAARLETLLVLQEAPFHQIETVCRDLSQTQVDPSLVAGEEGHTLFDFVDDASLSSLKTQAEGDLKEMWAWHERGIRAQTGMEERVLYLQHALRMAREEAGLLREEEEEGKEGEEEEEGRGKEGGHAKKEEEEAFEETWLWKTMEGNVTEQAAIIERMKAGLLKAASAYSRLTRTLGGRGEGGDSSQQQKSHHPSPLPPSSPPPRSPATEERELLLLLQSGIERMKALHLQMEQEVPSLLLSLRHSLLRLAKDDLLTITSEAHESVDALEGGQGRFNVLGEEVQGALVEMGSLAAFYSRFAKAYARLGPEVARRRKGLDETARVIEEVEERLRRRQEEEDGERKRFWEECGQYLPQSLCPLIQEPAEMFCVVPAVREVMAKLPELGGQGEEGERKDGVEGGGAR